MNKKKAVICTTMFATIIYSIGFICIDLELDILFQFVTGAWIYERIEQFYYWLRSTDR